MASSKNAGRRRFITREHTSDTSEADAATVRTPEEELCEQKRLERINLPRDTPSAFVRVAPSSKSAALDRPFRVSKNGLAVSSSKRLPLQQQQPSVPPSNSEFHPASERVVQQPLIYATLETATGLPPECDSLSLGFRPIRRDSLGSTSSSLAGSTVDSELTISNAPPDPLESPQRLAKLPPHPGGKDFTESASKLRPWSYYEGGMLMPRTVLSSAGSASSYDNLDKMDSSGQPKNPSQLNCDAAQVRLSPSPRFARAKHFDGNPKRTPSPPSMRRHSSPFRSDDDGRMQGNKVGDTSKEVLARSGEDKAESAHFLAGVCRRRMAGGHVQVIPPHLVGVFDPSRFLPSNAPSEANTFVDVEKVNSAPVVRQPESAAYHAVSKLPSKLPAQSSFARPSESSAKSHLPRVSVQHAGNDVADHPSGVHANPSQPFASKDSGLSRGDNSSRTSAPKLNVNRKSYKNDELLANDASPKFSDRHLFSTGKKVGNNTIGQAQELSSVTDLFHHVLPTVDLSHRGGPTFPDSTPRYTGTPESKNSQIPSTKTGSFLATNHSSPSKQITPKYAQTSNQKGSPKWERTQVSKGGKRSEHISSSPKARSSHDPTVKSSPKWERASSAKNNLTSSPKSSPKLERTTPGRLNLKWEAPSTAISAKVNQQASSAKGTSKWEPVAFSKEHTRSKAPSLLANATSDRLLPAAFSGSGNLERSENAHSLERARPNMAVMDNGLSRSHSTSTDSTRAMHERPTVSGDGSLPRSRIDRDKRKTTSTQLQTIGTADSVFSARRKQFSSPLSSHDKVDHQSRAGGDTMVDTASRLAVTTRHNMDEARDIISNSRLRSEASISPSDKTALDLRNSNSPRKAGDDFVSHSDAASDRTATSSASSSLLGFEKRGDAERQRRKRSESGESDAHSTRSSIHGAEVGKVSIGEDALREVTVVDGGGLMEPGSADDAVNGNSINSKDAKDSLASKSAEDAASSKGSASAFVTAKVSPDNNEIDASLASADKNSNFGVPQSKIQLSTCCSQTKTFTDILENIQVVTQPCGTSQKTPGTTPVFGPPSALVHFPFFDADDEPVLESSRCTVPDETFAVAAVDLSGEKAIECKVGQPSSVTDVVSGGEKSLGSCLGEFGQGKMEQNADAVNNNLKETGPSMQTISPSLTQTISPSTQTISPSTQTTSPSTRTIFSEQITSPVPNRSSLDSISSSSLVEFPTKDPLVDENPATEPVYSVTVSQELSYPTGVDKAIFMVDKEISFVSGLLEADNKGSLPRKVSLQTSTNLRNAGHTEYLPLRTESNIRLFTEPAPFTFTERDTVSQTDLLDKPPSPFQNSLPSGNVQAFSTLQSTNVTHPDPSFSRERNSSSPTRLLTVFDSCPLSTPVSQNDPGILQDKSDDLARNEKRFSELDESDDTVDPDGTESKVSTASLEQITQETEIFELARTSAAYLKPEIALLAKESERPTGKSELLCALSVPKPALQNHDSAKRDFVFTSKESSLPVNANQKSEYLGLDNRANPSPSKSEVSPVMAALDDALAVLTSVVMEKKTTTSDTLSRTTTSTAKSKKDASRKEDIEKAIPSLDTRKPAKSKITNKEGTPSKKRPGVSHKEQHAPEDSIPFASHHSDPQEVTDTVRHEIQAVEKRRHQLTKEDSFNRPDSPMFHETLPLPKDSIIKRNREHCRDSSSSSDSGGGSAQTSPRLAPRDLRRSKRCQDANKSCAVEISDYRPFVGVHSSGRGLSRHQSDIVLDMQSLPGGSSHPTAYHPHKTRRHNSDSAGGSTAAWPKGASFTQGMDAAMGVLPSAARDVKRRADRFPLPSDIQQSLLLYNQQHGGRRGQSWMQAVDASVEGTLTGTRRPKDKTG